MPGEVGPEGRAEETRRPDDDLGSLGEVHPGLGTDRGEPVLAFFQKPVGQNEVFDLCIPVVGGQS